MTSVDLAQKEVSIDGGKEKVKYGTLVLAPGSAARRLPIEGVELQNVYTLRNVQDAAKIDVACKEGKKLVIIGSSFIGMELAVATADRKMAARHVVSMDKVPFESVCLSILSPSRSIVADLLQFCSCSESRREDWKRSSEIP